MARRSRGGADAVGVIVLVVTCAIASVFIAIVTVISRPEFWFVAGIALLVFGGYKAWSYYWEVIWPDKYFASKEFLLQKEKIEDYVRECNELNDHIAELKSLQEEIQTSNRGAGTLRDTSTYNFQRSRWNNKIKGRNIHDCSRAIVNNAQNNPFKYLCKYFGINADESSLSEFESMLNDFSAAEEGAQLLLEKRHSLINSIVEEIHPRIRRNHWERLERELGFDEVIFDRLTFPTYSFQYVSAGGNSSLNYDIEFDIPNIEDFVDYLSELVKFKKSVAGQRALMTRSLRTYIKERDDYTCQMCGISARTSESLLLEIDHIMPLAKGGFTSEANLQTLCWKCNRAKGSRVLSC
jgi:hypothetical protein